MYSISTSAGGSFTFPNTLADVTLAQYIDFMTFVEPTKPAELIAIEVASQAKSEAETEQEKAKAWTEFEEAVQACDDVVMYRKVYPYFARVVAHFADDITEAEIVGGKKQGDGMNVGNLEYLYSSIVKMLNSYEEPEYTNVIMVGDELWYLPMRYMEKSTLIEYAESSQFEANLKDVQDGNFKALAKIMCVLVRKEAEQYSDKLLKREEMFLSWTLENCLKVAFFLLKRNETSQQNMLIYMAAQDLMNVKRELKN
jgi:hypothetical protein